MKCLPSLFLCLVLASGNLLSADEPPSPVPGIEALEKSQFDSSIAHFKKMLEANPAQPDILFYLGSAYLKAGKFDRAAEIYRDGTAQQPLDPRFHYFLGWAFERMGDYAAAIRAYQRAVTLDPSYQSLGLGRYDALGNAIFFTAVHDHAGFKACAGRFLFDGQHIEFLPQVAIGATKDDTFETDLSNVRKVEIDRKTSVMADYAIVAMIANLPTTPGLRKRGEIQRVDLKFYFKQPIKASRSDWTKEDIKFFFVEAEYAEKLIDYLKKAGVETILRSGSAREPAAAEAEEPKK